MLSGTFVDEFLLLVVALIIVFNMKKGQLGDVADFLLKIGIVAIFIYLNYALGVLIGSKGFYEGEDDPWWEKIKKRQKKQDGIEYFLKNN